MRIVQLRDSRHVDFASRGPGLALSRVAGRGARHDTSGQTLDERQRLAAGRSRRPTRRVLAAGRRGRVRGRGQHENGALGVGTYPYDGQEDPDLINAGKETVTVRKGRRSATPRRRNGWIRGGKIDAAMLVAMQVSSCKIVNECSLPYTGRGMVQRIITDLRVLDVVPTPEGGVPAAGRALAWCHAARGATPDGAQSSLTGRLGETWGRFAESIHRRAAAGRPVGIG